MVITAWENTETLGKLSKHRYGQLWTKKRPKTVFLPDALFSHFPGDLPTY